MNNHRWVTIVIAFCLGLSILGAEWTWGYSGGEFFWLRGISRIFPSACLLLLAIVTGAFGVRPNGIRFHFAVFGGLCFVGALMAQMTLSTKTERLVSFDYATLGTIQTVLFAFMGYWIGQDEREAKWLLQRFALACACASIFTTICRVAGLSGYPFLDAAWPVMLIVLFGYCWYLYAWLTSPWANPGSLFGVAACSLEVWVTFAKPIIFSAVVGSLFLFLYSMWTTRKRLTVVGKAGILSAMAAITLMAANAYTSGRMAAAVEDTIYNKFLHTDETKMYRIDSFEDLLEKASGGRWKMWQEAMGRFYENPWFGSGFGQSFSGIANDESIYVHNWYLDLLLSIGIVGSLPIFAVVVWWIVLVTRKRVVVGQKHFIVPCLAYFVSIMAYNCGGSIRIFFTMQSLMVLIMAITAALADRVLASTPTRQASPLSVRGSLVGKRS